MQFKVGKVKMRNGETVVITKVNEQPDANGVVYIGAIENMSHYWFDGGKWMRNENEYSWDLVEQVEEESPREKTGYNFQPGDEVHFKAGHSNTGALDIIAKSEVDFDTKQEIALVAMSQLIRSGHSLPVRIADIAWQIADHMVIEGEKRHGQE